MSTLLIGLLGGSAILLGVSVTCSLLAWAEKPGQIVPGWWRR